MGGPPPWVNHWISRYYRNYQHFFSNWHYVWRKMNFFCIFSFIFTMVDKSKFHFFQSFLPYFRVTPLPHSVAEKTSKSVKILPIGFSTKTRKSVITRRKWFFQNFRKKCTYGDFDENFSKFAGCLGVKENQYKFKYLRITPLRFPGNRWEGGVSVVLPWD